MNKTLSRREFLNTAATRVPATGEGPVRVALSRIR